MLLGERALSTAIGTKPEAKDLRLMAERRAILPLQRNDGFIIMLDLRHFGSFWRLQSFALHPPTQTDASCRSQPSCWLWRNSNGRSDALFNRTRHRHFLTARGKGSKPGSVE